MSSQNLKKGTNGQISEPAQTGQLHSSAGEGQLHNGQNDPGAFKSEEHRETFQNVNHSFNSERNQYAEHAMNAYEPPPEQETPQFQRYVEQPSGGLLSTRDILHGTEERSIFQASDFRNADATENYLSQNSERFSDKLERNQNKISNTEKAVRDLEANNLKYRNSYKPWKHRLTLQGEQERLLRKSYATSHKNNLLGQDRIHKIVSTQLPGKLKFRSEKIAYAEKKVRSKESKHRYERYAARHLLDKEKQHLRDISVGSEFGDDEIEEMLSKMRRRGRRAVRSLGWYTGRKVRRLKHELDGYGRLKYQKGKLEALNARRQLLQYQSGIDLQRRKTEEAVRQGLINEKHKKKIKKEMVQKEYGNFLTRTRNQHKLKKTVKKERRMAAKRAKTIVGAFLSIVMVVLFVFILFMLLLMILMNTGAGLYANTVSQNDYQTMTDVTAHFREKEAELEEYIKPENLEPVILEEEPEIYEFIYDMAEISFDANTLVAYLSAKYNEFDLEMVKADLEEIFEQYYHLSWEIKEEIREVPDETQERDPVTGEYPLVEKLVKICYVKLEKEDFYSLLQSRIEDAAKKNQMDGFYLSGNGQQIYGPVMNVDWRKKISSNYGKRVHPITGAVTMHNGVDIAIPTGTALYSAVKGTVIKSYYSDSAGNMITVENENGWQVTFMHMDSRAVSVGDEIEKGQYVGESGNTGNSTGPHLHLEVRDVDGNAVNPVFIVPFSTIEASETY